MNPSNSASPYRVTLTGDIVRLTAPVEAASSRESVGAVTLPTDSPPPRFLFSQVYDFIAPEVTE